MWRQNISVERSLQLLVIDPHGPNNYRVNGPLSNIGAHSTSSADIGVFITHISAKISTNLAAGEFHDAFGVREGDPMWRAQDERVDIW